MAVKWTVEILVSDTWVEDGFSLDGEDGELLAEHILPHAYGHEKQTRTIKREIVPDLPVD